MSDKPMNADTAAVISEARKYLDGGAPDANCRYVIRRLVEMWEAAEAEIERIKAVVEAATNLLPHAERMCICYLRCDWAQGVPFMAFNDRVNALRAALAKEDK